MPVVIPALIITAAAAGYALYLEVRRGRSVMRLSTWLETERPDAWAAVHNPGANVEDSIKKLRQRRLSDDPDFISRYAAAVDRGNRMVVAVVVFGIGVLVVLVALTVFA